jgi:PAS domain S-box-containing protein
MTAAPVSEVQAGSAVARVLWSCAVVIACVAVSRSGHASATEAAALPTGHIKARVFGGADGLHNMAINSIIQDSQGFLWLGTEEGVYHFDGQRFAHFGTNDGLASSQVYSMAIAPDGALCVGSYNGLACSQGDRFSSAAAGSIPAQQVFSMVTRGDRLWAGAFTGLYVRDRSGVFQRAPGWPGSPTTAVRALWADEAGLVVGNDEAEVWFSAGDGTWQSLGKLGLGKEPIEDILRDREGALWMRTRAHIWVLPRGASWARDVQDDLPMIHNVSWASRTMAVDARGDVVVAIETGLAYRDGDHWRIVDHALGLPRGEVRTLFVDREGTTWLGGAGLTQIRGRGLLEYHGRDTGLPAESVWTYGRDPQGTLWAGTNQCLARAVEGRWECLPGTEGRTVRGLAFPPQGGVFIAGVPSELLYIDPAGRTTSIGELAGIDQAVLAMAIGPDGDLWIGTKNGLFRLRGAVPGPIERVVVPGAETATWFASIVVVGDQLWTAPAPGGAAVLDHGTWHVFDSRSGLRSSSIAYLAARRDGRMCGAYHEAIGLSCFRYAGGVLRDVEHIASDQGLTTARVYFLGEDRDGRLWVGTGDAVDVITPQGIDHFDDSDGLAGNDSSATAFLLDRDGSLWLGANGGATHVLAQYYARPPAAPRTEFVAGRLGDRPIQARRASEPGATPRAGAVLEVAHDHNALTVELASSSLLDARRVEYQARLSPFERTWVTTLERQARYPALLPGAYHLEVRSRIGHGPWGPVSELRFAVLPAWWQTGWFLSLAVLAGLLAIGGGFAWRQRVVVRRRVRQVLAQSDASLRQVIDLMPDLIAVCRDQTVVYLNDAMRRFLGLEIADDGWAYRELMSRVHPDDLAQIAALFAQVRSQREGVTTEVCELRLRSSDTSWRNCEMSGVVVELAGQPSVVVSGRDVTERQRMRAKLLVSDRMASLGTLAAGIAHEINNPLSYVSGNLELAAEALDEPAMIQNPLHGELASAIRDARDGANRVREIVHGLRAFSRAEDEKRVPLALPQVLETAIRMTGNEVRHRAQLVREFETTPLVVADDSRLTQVFINLLINAAHAIPEGHTQRNRITVRTRSDDQHRAVVEIEDTGRGMAGDVQARVFDPFFTTKDVGEGTGLGLSICHGIVTGLGGQIAIESTLGKGTLVRVVLPGTPEAAVVAVEPAASGPVAAPGANRHRVLLIDDEPQVVYTTERLLRRDYEVTVALCGEDAMDLIARGARFDAIISDVMMPNMTGIELVEELQRVAPEQAQRLIFLSGGVFTEQTREALDRIGAPYLEKPITANELRGWVVRIAKRAGMRAA